MSCVHVRYLLTVCTYCHTWRFMPGMWTVVINHMIIINLFLFFVTVEAKDQISELTDEISRKAEDNIRQQVRTCTTTLWEIICEWLSMLNQLPLVYFSTGGNHTFDQHCGGFTKKAQTGWFETKYFWYYFFVSLQMLIICVVYSSTRDFPLSEIWFVVSLMCFVLSWT